VRYRNDRLREALAAEYTLGTLQGPARRRFERSLKGNPQLRRAVAFWLELLAPLNDRIEAIEPPARVWRQIQSKIALGGHTRPADGGFWADLAFWRAATLATSAAALLLAVWVTVLLQLARPQEMMVVVMSDDKATPALIVSWAIRDRDTKRLRVRVMAHAEMNSNTSAWELWMLPRNGGRPAPLALINTRETQTVIVASSMAEAVDAAWGLAMSVEPRGGSLTGLPTGPILYKGPCTKL
jgi:anti-sigma-K factor RskA